MHVQWAAETLYFPLVRPTVRPSPVRPLTLILRARISLYLAEGFQ